MRKLNLLWALLLSAVFVVGCNPDNPTPDNPQPQPGEKPVITLTEVEATFNTYSFEVTTTVAGTLGYAVVAEGYDAPKIDEIYALNSVELKDKATITIENLNDNTNYTLYAVLRTSDQQSAPKTLKFTTPDDGKVNPIVINSTTYDTISFTINIEGSYVFTCIDKAYLEYTNLTPEDYISTLGIGIPSTGVITVDWVNGGAWGSWSMNVREDSDYYVIAAIADGQNVVGDIFYQTTRTPKRPASDATVTIELTDITSTSVNIKATPDSDVQEYLVLVKDKVWSDDIVAGHGESMLATLVSRSGESWRLNSAKEAVWSGLLPNTDYICHVLVKDSKGAQSLILEPFKTLESSGVAPTIDATFTTAEVNGYCTLNLNIFSAEAASVMYALNTKADVDLVRNQFDYTDAAIVRNYGMALTAEQVEAIRTTGLTLKHEDLYPGVEYEAVISVKSAENVETVVAVYATTSEKPVPARVESELFTSLLGEWEVSYSLIQSNNINVTINNVKVIIAEGTEASSAEYYRSHNRLVIQGWPFDVDASGKYLETPYYTPSDLKSVDAYWANNPQLAERDCGPKIFFEIAEGDVVTVPSNRSEYFFNWSTENGIFYFFGADLQNEFTAPATFPVTISEDGNTIVIGACHSGAEFGYGIYRPAVFRNGTESWALATGDIILKRVEK